MSSPARAICDEPDLVRRKLRHVRFSAGAAAAASPRSLAISRRSTDSAGSRSNPSLSTCHAQPQATLPCSTGSSPWTWTSDGSIVRPNSCATHSTGFKERGFTLWSRICSRCRIRRRSSSRIQSLPRLVAPLLSHPNQAVWLIPTPDFRRAALDSRGSTFDIPNRTSDPERALQNILTRDRLFTEDVAREASARGLPVIHVDLGMTVDHVIGRVSDGFGLTWRSESGR